MAYAYDPPGRVVSGGTQPGTRALYDVIRERFCTPGVTLGNYQRHAEPLMFPNGTYVRKNANGPVGQIDPTQPLSAHAEGRAGDMSVRPVRHPIGLALAEWLVANWEVLGIQMVRWDHRTWGGPTGGPRWRRTDSAPHEDHVHWEITWHATWSLTRAQILALFVPAAPPTTSEATTVARRTNVPNVMPWPADGPYLAWAGRRPFAKLSDDGAQLQGWHGLDFDPLPGVYEVGHGFGLSWIDLAGFVAGGHGVEIGATAGGSVTVWGPDEAPYEFPAHRV